MPWKSCCITSLLVILIKEEYLAYLKQNKTKEKTTEKRKGARELCVSKVHFSRRKNFHRK